MGQPPPSSRGYRLPPDGQFMRQLFQQREKLINASTKFNPEMFKVRDEFNALIGENLDTFKDVHANASADERKNHIWTTILRDPQGAGAQLWGRLSEQTREKFNQLRAKRDDILRRSAEYEKPLIKETDELYNKSLDKYQKFLHENHVPVGQNNHPPNVRTLGATSQNEDVPGPDGNPDGLSWATRHFLKAIAEKPTLDDAIDETCKQKKSWGPSDDGTLPRMQVPVSTPISKQTAWRKDQNANPNVRRFAMVLCPDKAGSFKHEADTMKGVFNKQSAKDYRNPNPEKDSRYRVDELIEVDASKPENIRKAFEDAKAFVAREKQLVRDAAIAKAREEGKSEDEQRSLADAAAKELKFEGFAHWSSHGTVLTDKDPPEDGIFQEGSREFRYYMGGGKGFTEKEITDTEKENLGDFDYFINYFNGCRSGAIT